MRNDCQREMPFLAVVKAPQEVPLEFVQACRSELDALNLCMNLSGFADETIREHLGIDKGHFSRIRKGRGNFPPNKRVAVMTFCGNVAPVQYEAWMLGRDLVERKPETPEQRRIRELEARLEAAERRAA